MPLFNKYICIHALLYGGLYLALAAGYYAHHCVGWNRYIAISVCGDCVETDIIYYTCCISCPNRHNTVDYL